LFFFFRGGGGGGGGGPANFALQNIKRLVFVTEVQSVYSAVRTESLYNTDTFRLGKVKKGGEESIEVYWKDCDGFGPRT